MKGTITLIRIPAALFDTLEREPLPSLEDKARLFDAIALWQLGRRSPALEGRANKLFEEFRGLSPQERRDKRARDIESLRGAARPLSLGDKVLQEYAKTLPALPQPRPAMGAVNKADFDRALERHPDIDYWKALFREVSESEFLQGKNRRGWVATFFWLLNDVNADKVMAGRYNRDKAFRKMNRKNVSMEDMRNDEDYWSQ